jgi:hypothetical protein
MQMMLRRSYLHHVVYSSEISESALKNICVESLCLFVLDVIHEALPLIDVKFLRQV